MMGTRRRSLSGAKNFRADGDAKYAHFLHMFKTSDPPAWDTRSIPPRSTGLNGTCYILQRSPVRLNNQRYHRPPSDLRHSYSSILQISYSNSQLSVTSTGRRYDRFGNVGRLVIRVLKRH